MVTIIIQTMTENQTQNMESSFANNFRNTIDIEKLPVNLQEYYSLHYNFVQNLQKQSSKIEKLLALIDRLKQDNSTKQRQLQLLKRKEDESHKYRLNNQEQLREQYLNKLQIFNEKIRTLEQTNSQLQSQLAKTQHQLHRINNLRKLQNEALHYNANNGSNIEIEKLSKELQKTKNMLHNCKQENTVLRFELEEKQRLKGELESSLGKIGRKLENLAEKYEYKLEAKQKEIQNRDKEIKGLDELVNELRHHLDHFEGQTVHKLQKYDDQVKQMIKTVDKAQSETNIWRQKFYDIIEWVYWIQQMRQQSRYQQIQADVSQKIQQFSECLNTTIYNRQRKSHTPFFQQQTNPLKTTCKSYSHQGQTAHIDS